MWLLSLVSLPFVIGLSFYLYRFLRRIFQTFGADIKIRKIKVILILITVLCAIGMVDISSMFALTLLHIVAFASVVQLVNFIIRKISGERYERKCLIWKKIYGYGIIPILSTVILLTYGYFNLHHVVETRYTVYTDKNIRDEGYRIALLADVHFGVSINYEELIQKCEEISAKDVDVVILCGDIVDNSTTKEEMRQVFQALSTIESSYGTFYVHGNHDRPMSMIKSEYTEEELVNTISENGIVLLQDDIYEISDDFVLVGREDRSAGKRESISNLLENVSKEDFILTLDHQPNQYKENGTAGTDLLLSGHTHGGQIFPLNYIQEIVKFNDAVYGHTWIDGDTQAIVTSGVAGWSYPVKTAAPAEYVIIDIVEK